MARVVPAHAPVAHAGGADGQVGNLLTRWDWGGYCLVTKMRRICTPPYMALRHLASHQAATAEGTPFDAFERIGLPCICIYGREGKVVGRGFPHHRLCAPQTMERE